MRVFIIPGAVLVVAAVAVGCDQGTPTSPSADALVPQFHVFANCPPAFTIGPVDGTPFEDFIDQNGDGKICARGAGPGVTLMDNNTSGPSRPEPADPPDHPPSV